MTTNQQDKIRLEKAFEEAGFDLEALFYDTYEDYSLVVIEIWHSLEPDLTISFPPTQELEYIVASVFPEATGYIDTVVVGNFGTFMFLF